MDILLREASEKLYNLRIPYNLIAPTEENEMIKM